MNPRKCIACSVRDIAAVGKLKMRNFLGVFCNISTVIYTVGVTHQSGGSSHVYIAVGEALAVVRQRGLHVQVNNLVHLLRQEGVGEKFLQSVVVVLWKGHSEFSEGGAYTPGARVTHRCSKDAPARVFTTVIHINLDTRLRLPFVLLHEAGHVRADAMGGVGAVLYGAKNTRRVRIGGMILGPIAWLSWLAAMLAGGPYAAYSPWLIGVFTASVFCTICPGLVLWFLSAAEWKANWFYWRHRKVKLVGVVSDGTEMLFSPDANITVRTKSEGYSGG